MADETCQLYFTLHNPAFLHHILNTTIVSTMTHPSPRLTHHRLEIMSSPHAERPDEISPLAEDITEVDDDPAFQRLPNELIARVMDCLRDNQHLETLAKFAQASKASQELAIPKLYRTIYVTRNNIYKILQRQDDEDSRVGLGLSARPGEPDNIRSSITRTRGSCQTKARCKILPKSSHNHPQSYSWRIARRSSWSAISPWLLSELSSGKLYKPRRHSTLRTIPTSSSCADSRSNDSKMYGDAALNSLHTSLSLETSKAQSCERTAIYLHLLMTQWVTTTIARLACSDRTVNVVIVGLGLSHRPLLYPSMCLGNAVRVTVYFCPDHVRALSYEKRAASLAHFVLQCFTPQESGLNMLQLNLVDVPSLILPKDVLPKDKAEANTLARATLKRLSETISDEAEVYRGRSAGDSMATVSLIDSPDGAEIRWKEPEPVSSHDQVVCCVPLIISQAVGDFGSDYGDYDDYEDPYDYDDPYGDDNDLFSSRDHRYLDDNDSEAEYH